MTFRITSFYLALRYNRILLVNYSCLAVINSIGLAVNRVLNAINCNSTAGLYFSSSAYYYRTSSRNCCWIACCCVLLVDNPNIMRQNINHMAVAILGYDTFTIGTIQISVLNSIGIRISWVCGILGEVVVVGLAILRDRKSVV